MIVVEEVSTSTPTYSATDNLCTKSASDIDAGTAWNALTCNEGMLRETAECGMYLLCTASV